jgi:hypothetical protein
VGMSCPDFNAELLSSCDVRHHGFGYTQVVLRTKNHLGSANSGGMEMAFPQLDGLIGKDRKGLLRAQDGDAAADVSSQASNSLTETSSILRSPVAAASALRSSSVLAGTTAKQRPWRSPRASSVLNTCSGGIPILAATVSAARSDFVFAQFVLHTQTLQQADCIRLHCLCRFAPTSGILQAEAMA